MKLSIVMSKRFRQDLKRAKKRGFDLMQLETVIDKIANRELLELKYHDHNLSGDLSGFRECHISPDWLLVYRVEDNELELFLFRTGTHSDLF